jgi:Uri superfamily endonuclease
MKPPFITYQLSIHLKNKVTITIGKLGTFEFPAGHYIYTGSAKSNIEARITRHLSQKKSLKWHIDYLLNSQEAYVIKVARFTEPECIIHQRTEGLILINKLGSTDCKNSCGSHLKFLG